MAADREQDADNSGVNHYISKPFDADTLESTIRVALREVALDLDRIPNKYGLLILTRSPTLPVPVRITQSCHSSLIEKVMQQMAEL